MKQNYRNSIVLLVVLAVGGMTCIHFLFKIHAPKWLVATWSAGDALGYFGVILAAVVTVYGLFLTFKDNRESIFYFSRLDKLPFIGVNVLSQNYRLPFMIADASKEADYSNTTLENRPKGQYYYSEEKLEKIFCVLSSGNIHIQRGLKKKQLHLAQNMGMDMEPVGKGGFASVDKRLIYYPILIENIGNGPAIDLRIGFQKDDADTKNFIPPFPLNTSATLYFIIYAENPDDSNCGDYSLIFYYRDIFDHYYKQSHLFQIKHDDTTGLISEFVCQSNQEIVDKSDVPYAE